MAYHVAPDGAWTPAELADEGEVRTALGTITGGDHALRVEQGGTRVVDATGAEVALGEGVATCGSQVYVIDQVGGWVGGSCLSSLKRWGRKGAATLRERAAGGGPRGRAAAADRPWRAPTRRGGGPIRHRVLPGAASRSSPLAVADRARRCCGPLPWRTCRGSSQQISRRCSPAARRPCRHRWHQCPHPRAPPLTEGLGRWTGRRRDATLGQLRECLGRPTNPIPP
jgi:hypothetical protein